MANKKTLFISGGGPAGLAAALLFDQLGWDEIILAERRDSPGDFEKNKSFNYLIEERGQKLLRRIGIDDRLHDYGVDTNAFTATTITPDGKPETKTFPIVDPDRPTCFWMTRRALLTMLYEAIEQRASDRIKMLYGHKVCGIERTGGKQAQVVVEGPGQIQKSFTPDLILACDGLNSVMRHAVADQPDVPDGHFDMIASSSISTGLRYKVLNLPSSFETADGKAKVDDNRMSYIIPSRHTDRLKTCALFAFPVVDPDHPRSVNMIREPDHALWTIKDADALLAFLTDSFPQLDITNLVSRQEAEDFVNLEPGAFPAPQYAKNLHARLGPEDKETHCLLIGDAAHAFPPDLGLGVNAALEDLEVLATHYDAHKPLAAIASNYAEARWPEGRDLTWIVEKTFPEQYNHRPWRLKIWAIGFIVRKGLHAIAPGLFDKPAFYLCQDPEMPYAEMKRRKLRTDLRVRGLGLGLLAVLVGALVLALN